MNREIEFRGYDPDTKRWYYGSYVRLERVSGYAWSQSPDQDNKKHQENDFDDYIFFTEMNDWGLETKKKRATVDPKSVGQFTGLRDKNGVKIFEGDILDAEDRIVTVEFHSPSASFDSSFVKYKSDGVFDKLRNQDWSNRTDIIGNVYDNPELIK